MKVLVDNATRPFQMDASEKQLRDFLKDGDALVIRWNQEGQQFEELIDVGKWKPIRTKEMK